VAAVHRLKARHDDGGDDDAVEALVRDRLAQGVPLGAAPLDARVDRHAERGCRNRRGIRARMIRA
jgi:hypothetical protein